MKKPATIEIGTMESQCCPELKFYVNFWGFNEGSASPLKDEKEVEERVKKLIKEYQDKYKIEINDRRVKQKTLF